MFVKEEDGKDIGAMEDLVLKHIEDSIHVKEQLAKTSLKVITQIADEIIRAYRKRQQGSLV